MPKIGDPLGGSQLPLQPGLLLGELLHHANGKLHFPATTCYQETQEWWRQQGSSSSRETWAQAGEVNYQLASSKTPRRPDSVVMTQWNDCE